jgi:hypothetical protein
LRTVREIPLIQWNMARSLYDSVVISGLALPTLITSPRAAIARRPYHSMPTTSRTYTSKRDWRVMVKHHHGNVLSPGLSLHSLLPLSFFTVALVPSCTGHFDAFECWGVIISNPQIACSVAAIPDPHRNQDWSCYWFDLIGRPGQRFSATFVR